MIILKYIECYTIAIDNAEKGIMEIKVLINIDQIYI